MSEIYQKGFKVPDAEMDALDLAGDAFHPEWNYTIKPRRFAESAALIVIGVSVLAWGPALKHSQTRPRRPPRPHRMSRE